jgi:hypothetical protein
MTQIDTSSTHSSSYVEELFSSPAENAVHEELNGSREEVAGVEVGQRPIGEDYRTAEEHKALYIYIIYHTPVDPRTAWHPRQRKGDMKELAPFNTYTHLFDHLHLVLLPLTLFHDRCNVCALRPPSQQSVGGLRPPARCC